MNEKIKQWYHSNYPTDSEFVSIKENVTFQDLFDAMDNYKGFYKTVGENCDSVIRERIFEKLAGIIEVNYNYIYDQWLLCKE
ncbi:MAG: hypothetical protein PHG18_04480 [Bacilli bacterium]|nr:hypothetical protein [Bacilli bacterium]